ncbi:MAG: recombinase family protein [Oscillospiraceae bacterium]|nr:recombinase family protein [Oscillospiraceae bacterium]
MRVVLYAKYSSDNQTENSIDGQLRECGDFGQRKGYTIVNTYVDRAISGKKADNKRNPSILSLSCREETESL